MEYLLYTRYSDRKPFSPCHLVYSSQPSNKAESCHYSHVTAVEVSFQEVSVMAGSSLDSHRTSP